MPNLPLREPTKEGHGQLPVPTTPPQHRLSAPPGHQNLALKCRQRNLQRKKYVRLSCVTRIGHEPHACPSTARGFALTSSRNLSIDMDFWHLQCDLQVDGSTQPSYSKFKFLSAHVKQHRRDLNCEKTNCHVRHGKSCIVPRTTQCPLNRIHCFFQGPLTMVVDALSWWFWADRSRGPVGKLYQTTGGKGARVLFHVPAKRKRTSAADLIPEGGR